MRRKSNCILWGQQLVNRIKRFEVVRLFRRIVVGMWRYIIGCYKPSVKITTSGGTCTFKVDPERQIFEKVFHRIVICWEADADEIFVHRFRLVGDVLTWGLNHRGSSTKLTHRLLDNGDIQYSIGTAKLVAHDFRIIDWYLQFGGGHPNDFVFRTAIENKALYVCSIYETKTWRTLYLSSIQDGCTADVIIR